MTHRKPLFLQHDLLALDGGDLVLIGRNHGGVRRFDDPGEKAFNLPVELGGIIGKALRKGMGLGQPLIPAMLHQRPDHRKERGRRNHGLQHRRERAFDLIPPDRLALLRAGAVEAGVIGVALSGLALGPRRRQGPLTAGAGDCPAQGEVGIEIGPGRSARTVLQTLLDALEGLKAHQPLMLSLAKGHTPVRRFDISGIKRLGQNLGDEAAPHHAGAVLGECRTAFQKALHFGLRVEPSRGEAFHGFLNDGGQRLIAHQHLAATGGRNVLQTHAGDEGPIAVLNPRPHPVAGLLRVLLALMLRDGREQVLNKDGVGILTELNRRAFQPSARRSNRIAQIEVRFHVPRQTRDIVDQDNVLRASIGFEVFEHGQHSGAVDQTAGNRFIAEDVRDPIALHPGELAAACFLRTESMALLHLRDAGDARIDDGGYAGFGFIQLCGRAIFHGVSPPCICGIRFRHRHPPALSKSVHNSGWGDFSASESPTPQRTSAASNCPQAC